MDRLGVDDFRRAQAAYEAQTPPDDDSPAAVAWQAVATLRQAGRMFDEAWRTARAAISRAEAHDVSWDSARATWAWDAMMGVAVHAEDYADALADVARGIEADAADCGGTL